MGLAQSLGPYLAYHAVTPLDDLEMDLQKVAAANTGACLQPPSCTLPTAKLNHSLTAACPACTSSGSGFREQARRSALRCLALKAWGSPCSMTRVLHVLCQC